MNPYAAIITKPEPKRSVMVVFGSLGLALLAFGLYRCGLNVSFLVAGTATHATVVAVRHVSFHDGSVRHRLGTRGGGDFVDVAPLTGAAKGVRLALNVGYPTGTIHVGDTLRVLVLNTVPPQARSRDPAAMWTPPLAITGLGALMLWAAIAIYRRN